jgi:hypothetical protein
MESAELVSAAVGTGGGGVRVALHCAVVPPLLPPHDQVYVLVFVLTLDAVPVEQRFEEGGTEKEAPFEDPHDPLTGTGAMYVVR